MELNKRLKECRKLLAELGPGRDTSEEQLKYLLEIATRFQRLSDNALAAKYWVDGIFDEHPDLRLATDIVARNEQFCKTFDDIGHIYDFEVGSEAVEDFQPHIVPAPMVLNLAKNRSNSSDSSVGPELISTRTIAPHPDIEDILHENDEIRMPENEGIIEWLTEVYRASRGFELGTFDPSLLAVTFAEQSKRWPSISRAFVSDAVTIVHNFFTELLRIICPDEHTRSALASILMDGLLERYKNAIAQVEFILQVERSERPSTQNHYFADNLENR